MSAGFSEISSCVSAYFRTTLRRARSRDARACVYFRSVNEVTLKGALSTRSTFCRSGQRSGPSCHAFCSGAFIKSELPVGKLRRPSSVLRLGFHLADFGSPPSRARGATGYNRGSMTGWTNCNIHTQESKRLVYICFSILQFCFARVGLACAAFVLLHLLLLSSSRFHKIHQYSDRVFVSNNRSHHVGLAQIAFPAGNKIEKLQRSISR